jgi:hypothetical protein
MDETFQWSAVLTSCHLTPILLPLAASVHSPFAIENSQREKLQKNCQKQTVDFLAFGESRTGLMCVGGRDSRSDLQAKLTTQCVHVRVGVVFAPSRPLAMQLCVRDCGQIAKSLI